MVHTSRTHTDHQTKPRYGSFWSSPSLLLIIFAAGLALTLLISYQSAQSTRDAIESRFHSRSDQVIYFLQEHIEHYELLLQSARGAILNTTELPPSAQANHWHRMFNSFDLDLAKLGIVGLSYTAFVPAGQQDAFSIYHADSSETPLKIYPTPETDKPSFVILYLSPKPIQRHVRGYDIASGPARYEAATQARQSGRVSVTTPLSLLPSDISSLDYLLLLPVQSTGQHKDGFMGWTSLGFSMSQIINQSLQPLDDSISVSLYDPRQAQLEPIFTSHADKPSHAGPSHTDFLTLGSERIRLDFHSLDVRINALYSRQFDLGILVAGAAVTLLLSIALMSFIIARARTDRANRQLQTRAIEVQDRYRILFEQCPEAAVVHINGQVELANSHAALLFGYATPDQLLSRHIRELVHPSSMELVKKRGFSRQPGEIIPPSEQTLMRQDGTTFEAEVTSSRVFLNGQHAVQVLFRDISIDQQARREARIAKALIQHSQEAIMVTDASGNIEMVNQAFETLTGYSRKQVIGENAAVMNSGQHGKAFFFELWRSLKQKGKWQGHIINRRHDGSTFAQQTQISAVYDDQHSTTHFVCLLSDASDRLATQNQQQLKALHPVARRA